MYELLTSGGREVRRRLIDAALSDSDAVIRARAIRSVPSTWTSNIELRFSNGSCMMIPFQRFEDLSLAALSEHMPDRIAGLFPDVLFDRAASVRRLARSAFAQHAPTGACSEGRVRPGSGWQPARQLAAAIEGVGETGARADADLLAPFLSVDMARIRRFALRALAKLDAERAIFIGGNRSTRRRRFISSLSGGRHPLDQCERCGLREIVSRRVQSLSDPHARGYVLRVFLDAPKWEALVFLLGGPHGPR